MDTFVALVVVGLLIWWVRKGVRSAAHGPKTGTADEDRTLERIEGMMLRHLGDFPALSNDEIAQLVRDDLLNARVKDPTAFKWATADTAGRMRRNITRSAIALEARRAARPLEKRPEQTPEFEAGRRCRACRKLNDGDAEFCTKCGRSLEPSSDGRSGGPEVIRLRRCTSCGTKNKGSAYRCSKCGDVFAA